MCLRAGVFVGITCDYWNNIHMKNRTYTWTHTCTNSHIHAHNIYIYIYVCVCTHTNTIIIYVCVFYRQQRCILHVYAWHLEMVNDQCAALEFCSAPNFMSRRCSKKSCTTAVSIAEGLCSFSGNLIGKKDVWDKRIRATGKRTDLSPKTALKNVAVRENWGNAPAAPKALWGFKFKYIYISTRQFLPCNFHKSYPAFVCATVCHLSLKSVSLLTRKGPNAQHHDNDNAVLRHASSKQT